MIAVLGIDPGVKGGVVVLGQAHRVLFARGLRPAMTEAEYADVLRQAVEVLAANGGWFCYQEKVGYIRGDGGQGAFTFGGVYKFARGYLFARGVRIFDVPPVLWQARLECLTGGDKNVSKRKAVELFGSELTVTHYIADALLIARYGQLASAPSLG